MTIALGLVLVGVLLVYGGVTGRSIKSLLLGDNSVPSTPPTPIDRGSGTVTTLDGTTVTGTVVSPGGNYKGAIHELFYDPLNIAFDEGQWIPNIGNHSDHVHVAFADPNSAIQIINYAKALGLRVTENPYIDNVDPVHTDGSWHYKVFPGFYHGKRLGMGLDASGTKSAMDQFANWVKLTYTNKPIVTHK
jgi:hypothetical protein